ncbi:dynein regulatory complex protein 11 [Agrilus planipennis]|uniref:Dynein regulatory complex protein 11 n=1 Tax=Agrilus planipennis TaxID=224129 RepID=A0A1W4XU38_AGRPL|nr:dynein regulatory complex protein 11 [Agrilus planipennis]
MSEYEAILIIQTHERARQGRVRTQFMKEIKMMKEKGRQAAEEEEERRNRTFAAAIKIQKLWRGYMARRQTKRRKFQEMVLIGMVPQPKPDRTEINKALEIEEYRRKLLELRQKEYEHEIREIMMDLEKTQRGNVLEQLNDQVRNWLFEYKTHTGKIPEYTGPERSVSRLMLSRTGTESTLSKSSSSKESKSKKSKSAKSKDSKSNDEEEEDSSRAIVSTFVPELTIRKEEYDEIWRHKNESVNPYQHPYTDIIHNEQMIEMENELRREVDETMKGELELLQEAYERDRGRKTRKSKAAKKARRGAKKSKKKKEKDLTPDRTTESLFEELVANGIIREFPEVYLNDFRAERSFSEPAPHNKGREPKLALGEIRQVVKEYCVLPLLSPQIHQQTPHVRSVLLAGPKGCGKDMLVNAICSETGAVLFDLTPANIVGKYPGKTGLIMLIHLVTKVSRLLQPAVIYMDNAERPFVKKVPKADKTDPKRLKKDLPKIVKNFSPEDRVILIGVSSCPWDSDQKLLQQVYQKILVLPRPDYASRYSLWKHLLGQYSAITWQFDVSGMSRISDGYTAGAITKTVREVMTVKRMVQLRVQPLSPLELINALSKMIPVYKEEEDALINWWSKTPMCKRRSQAVEALIEEEAEMQAKQANAKKRK